MHLGVQVEFEVELPRALGFWVFSFLVSQSYSQLDQLEPVHVLGNHVVLE